MPENHSASAEADGHRRRSATVRRRRPAGFTIVELLVVIGILTVLMGLLLPALRSFRNSARRTVELSAARQLMIAYQAYADSYKGMVLPGYLPGLPARDRSGRKIAEMTTPVAAARYPWRLAPFLDYNFEGLYVNEQGEALEEFRNDTANYMYVVSLFPSLGLNTTWVGGDKRHFGFPQKPGEGQDFFIPYGTFYITRLSESPHPDRQLVFASARGCADIPGGGGGDQYSQVFEGYFEIQAPYFTESQGYLWSEEHDIRDPVGCDAGNAGIAAPGDFGFVSLRYGGEAVTAFIDGHTGTLNKTQISDMRYWARDAEREDWGLTPAP
jgi:prepilin-type N-terminal cleavage/methylation domain-containing protein